MIKELVIMGGAYGITEHGFGNVTPVAEFNIYADPEAAKIMFESGVPLKAIGLDATMLPKNQLTLTEYVSIKKSKGRVAAFAAKILNKNIHKQGQAFIIRVCQLQGPSRNERRSHIRHDCCRQT